MSNRIIILGGDPNSINSEIIYKAWNKLNNNEKKNILLLANYDLIRAQYRKLGSKINLIKVKDVDENHSFNYLKIIDIPLSFKNPFKVSLTNSSKYIQNSLNLAHKFGLSKKIKGIINCPINKQLLKYSKKIGVTEFLASKCKIYDGSEVMMIYNKRLSIVPLTTHINIKDVPKYIKSDLIIKKVETLEKNFRKLFRKKPKIGVLGLNPHNGEFNKNSEEVLSILPSILKLKKRGINITGPLAADTTFINNYKKYNVIIGMYHDQILGPFKTLFHFDAINLTLGLDYIRVSPDHGPAIDLIGANKANYLSLFKCIKFLKNLNK